MSLPVYEQIMAALATKIATCLQSNGYQFNVTKVVRIRLGETPDYLPGTVQIGLDSVTRVTSVDTSQSPWIECLAEIEVMVIVAATIDGDPVETVCSVAERDVHAAINVEARMDGLCDLLTLDRVDRFDVSPGDVAGTVLTYSAVFMMNEYDLSKGRLDG